MLRSVSAAFILALGLIALPALPAASPRPNFLLVLADDLGFSDLGSFGGEISTPHLDALAHAGLRMTSLYTSARCCPSRASLLTGQHPHRVGLGHMVRDLGTPGYRGTLAPEARTLAQMLQPAGYRSFISGKWHLGTPDPTQHGFEEFYGTLTSAQTYFDPAHFLRLPATRRARTYPDGEFYGTDAITDHALDFLAEARRTPDRPWFLYVAYHAPHFPLQAKPADIARYADRYHAGWDRLREERLARMKRLGIVPADTSLPPRSAYTDWDERRHAENPAWESLAEDRRADLARRMAIFAAMVECMDRNLGRIVADLRATGELERTLIVFLSDNGACAEWDPRGFDGKSGPENRLHRGDELARMGGRGTYHSVGSGWANASNTPWRMYKHYMHEGGLSTPAIVHWPERVQRRGEIDSQPAHLVDLAATLLDAAGVPDAGPLRPAGISLLPLFRGGTLLPRTLAFEHEGNRAVVAGDWKLTLQKGGSWQLYDRARDRTELHDLSARHPEIVARLDRAWQDWAESNHVLPEPADYGVGYLKPRGR
jgi:arylsulfatase